VIALGLAVMLGIAGVVVSSVPGMSKPIKSLFASSNSDVITYVVRSGPLPITVVEKGTLESSDNKDAYCLVEGQTTIIKILPEGTPVKKGDLVCELDSASLNDQLVNQKITTESAKANLDNAKLTREVAEIAVKEYVEGIFVQDEATAKGEIKLAESDLSRSEDRLDWATRMFEKGYVSKASAVSEELNLKKAKFALEQAETKLKVLLEYTKAKTIKELQSEVEKARSDELAKQATWKLEVSKEEKLVRMIKYCQITAPSDGLVVYANDPSRNWGNTQPQIEEGATVRERQKIFSLPDITKMQVNTKVHESQIDNVKAGMKARVRVDAFADQTLSASVKDVAPLPDPSSFFSSDIKVYTTHVTIDQSPSGLRPGMTAQVEILVDRRENVLTVPVLAILEFNGKAHITKKLNDSFVQSEVEVVATNEKFVQIDKGIKDGDVVVLNPMALMTDEEKREAFGASAKSGKKDWDGPGGAEAAAKAAAGPGAATKKSAVVLGGGAADPAKAKAKGTAKKKGGFGNNPIMAKLKSLSGEEKKQFFTGTEEEKAEIAKKAGITDAELDMMKSMRGGGGGGGFGGGGGRGRGGPPSGE
jgi:RND family efflux transporter MFP subunit